MYCSRSDRRRAGANHVHAASSHPGTAVRDVPSQTNTSDSKWGMVMVTLHGSAAAVATVNQRTHGAMVINRASGSSSIRSATRTKA